MRRCTTTSTNLKASSIGTANKSWTGISSQSEEGHLNSTSNRYANKTEAEEKRTRFSSLTAPGISGPEVMEYVNPGVRNHLSACRGVFRAHENALFGLQF